MANQTYVHDCDGCVFLGNYTWKGELHDLYVCKQGMNWPTVIARHSSDGPDYYSGLGPAMQYEKNGIDEDEKKHPLVEAMKRAKEHGHLTKKDTKHQDEESPRL